MKGRISESCRAQGERASRPFRDWKSYRSDVPHTGGTPMPPGKIREVAQGERASRPFRDWKPYRSDVSHTGGTPMPPGKIREVATFGDAPAMKLVIRLALAVALVSAISCSRPGPGTLRVLCGSSMAAPMKELAKDYTQKTGAVVEFDLGGSETLLPKILAGAAGDIFVCHDPFEQKVRDGKRWDRAVAVGYLQPVLAVQPRNPRGVRSLADLARPGLRIGIGDPRYSTCGELFLRALDQRGVTKSVMPQIVQQARSPSDVANGLLVGALDVAVIWNFSAALYADRLEVVDMGLTYPETRVTLIGLTGSPNPRQRDAFLQWCSRPEALEVFRRHGYTKTQPSDNHP